MPLAGNNQLALQSEPAKTLPGLDPLINRIHQMYLLTAIMNRDLHWQKDVERSHGQMPRSVPRNPQTLHLLSLIDRPFNLTHTSGELYTSQLHLTRNCYYMMFISLKHRAHVRHHVSAHVCFHKDITAVIARHRHERLHSVFTPDQSTAADALHRLGCCM